MLKLATESDVPELIGMCKSFHDHSPFKDSHFNPQKTRELILFILTHPQDGIIVMTEGGFLAGMVSTLHFSDVRVASELAWWVDPKHRGKKDSLKLLEAYEYWARNIAKVNQIQLANLTNEYQETLNKLYTRKGYEKKEETWLLVL